ncbi:hypothetical protein BOTBODRAFT_177070 [Botryobasidium botryosum FD-172 SS1]|uniref:Uncharacterized protein n=1 Tax=Botryobasidium botryosum (strain FD-172 SS1) TaxID=930990 RepID=A0A067M7B7_BOTB1|nr:hypothetical protein BOTBODRAFT_177070 [Botryobasidium botryosum FD-172 SS1]
MPADLNPVSESANQLFSPRQFFKVLQEAARSFGNNPYDSDVLEDREDHKMPDTPGDGMSEGDASNDGTPEFHTPDDESEEDAPGSKVRHFEVARAILDRPETQHAIQNKVSQCVYQLCTTKLRVEIFDKNRVVLSAAGAISLAEIEGRITWARQLTPSRKDSDVFNHICYELLSRVYPAFTQHCQECLDAVMRVLEAALTDHEAFYPSWAARNRYEVLAAMHAHSVQARMEVFACPQWVNPLQTTTRTDAQNRHLLQLENRFRIEYSTSRVQAFCPVESKTTALLQALRDFGCQDFEALGDLLPFLPEGAMYEEELTVLARAAAYWSVAVEETSVQISAAISKFVNNVAHSLATA